MLPLLNDIHIATRSFLKSIGFTATVILTLALAIGVNTATFAIVNSVLLRPLPVPDAGRIVLMANQYPKAGVTVSDNSAPGDYYDRMKEVPALGEQALWGGRDRTLDLKGVPTKVSGMAVTPSFFRVLQVGPRFGRSFTDAEGEIGDENKVMLSDGLSKELFGAGTDSIGKQVRLDGKPYEVVGVMPAGFLFVNPDVRFWFPIAFDAETKQLHHSNNWHNIARLKPGATIEQVQSQVDALNTRNLDRFPAFKQLLINAGYHTSVEPLQEMLVRDTRRVLYLLWGGAMLVLLIGGINVANLALARLALRRKEFATRMAIGAGRLELLRQIVVEHLLLALGGGALGVLLGIGLLRALALFGLDHFPRASEVNIDFKVVAVSIGLAVVAGILIALMPLADVFRTNLSSVLHEDGRGGTGGVSARRTRQGLVALQIGMAFALLVGAGLLLTSFRQLMRVNPGFRTQGIVVATVNPPLSRYGNNDQLRSFESRALEAMRALPQVTAAAVTDTVPFSGNYNDSVILAEGHQMEPGESVVSPRQITVSPGFFEMMDVGLVAGRFFTDSDTDKAPLVIIIDERLARKFWPGRDPIGMRMRFPSDPNDLLKIDEHTKWLRVVGVVKSVRIEDLAGNQNSVGAYYFPYAQSPRRNFGFVVRADGDLTAVEQSIRATVASIDPELAIADMRTMMQRTELSLAPRRASMSLALGFGALALFLAAVGIYGVLAYVVAQRNREIGIRMALGSKASNIVQLVLRESLSLTAIGMAIGVAGAVALQKVIANEVYGVKPLDPLVMAGVALLLFAVTVVASVEPARRAANVHPATVLRG
ncbi:MAG TPA: ABC transporter permease [Bryobacteraceae bacterium]|jgi:predicted permease